MVFRVHLLHTNKTILSMFDCEENSFYMRPGPWIFLFFKCNAPRVLWDKYFVIEPHYTQMPNVAVRSKNSFKTLVSVWTGRLHDRIIVIQK